MTDDANPRKGRPARRREIVDTARAIAAEQGWAAVTVRAMAARMGCSAPGIYQYFRDKDAVLDALAADGTILLAAALDEAAAGRSGPGKKLRAMVKALWTFSQGNRELYAVMFGLDGLAAHQPTGGASAAPPALVQGAAEFLAKRHVGDAAAGLADQLLALTHGFVALAQAGRVPGGGGRASDLLSDAVDALLKRA